MILTERLKIEPFTADCAAAFLDLTQDDGFTSYPEFPARNRIRFARGLDDAI